MFRKEIAPAVDNLVALRHPLCSSWMPCYRWDRQYPLISEMCQGFHGMYWIRCFSRYSSGDL